MALEKQRVYGDGEKVFVLVKKIPRRLHDDVNKI